MMLTMRVLVRNSLNIWACMVILLAACQSEKKESQPPSVGLSKDRGTLEGFVRLAGNALPGPTRIENTTDPQVCGRLQTLEDLLVSPKTHGIQNVIVALKDLPAFNSLANHTNRLVLNNRECKFVPHVSVLTVGDTIEAKNSDPTMHNVHFYGALNANIALPLKGMKAARKVNKPGMVIVKCDIHGWMQAFIRVDSHPFHAVTDNNGYFSIPDIPAGTYNLEIWHERLGQLQKTIHIKSTKTESIEVEYSLNNH